MGFLRFLFPVCFFLLVLAFVSVEYQHFTFWKQIHWEINISANSKLPKNGKYVHDSWICPNTPINQKCQKNQIFHQLRIFTPLPPPWTKFRVFFRFQPHSWMRNLYCQRECDWHTEVTSQMQKHIREVNETFYEESRKILFGNNRPTDNRHFCWKSALKRLKVW